MSIEARPKQEMTLPLRNTGQEPRGCIPRTAACRFVPPAPVSVEGVLARGALLQRFRQRYEPPGANNCSRGSYRL